jgi:hypothetical protein
MDFMTSASALVIRIVALGLVVVLVFVMFLLITFLLAITGFLKNTQPDLNFSWTC